MCSPRCGLEALAQQEHPTLATTFDFDFTCLNFITVTGFCFDKGGLLQLGSGELYITQLSGLHILEKDVYFFPLVLNTGRAEYLLRNTALMSGVCYPDCISTDQPQVSQVLTRQGDFQTVRIIHSEYCPEYIFRIKGILVKKKQGAREGHRVGKVNLFQTLMHDL